MLAGESWPHGCYDYVRVMFAEIGIDIPTINYNGTAEEALAALDALSDLYEEVETPEVGCVIVGKCATTNRRHLYLVEDSDTVTHMADNGVNRLGVVRQKISEIEIVRVLRYVGCVRSAG